MQSKKLIADVLGKGERVVKDSIYIEYGAGRAGLSSYVAKRIALNTKLEKE